MVFSLGMVWIIIKMAFLFLGDADTGYTVGIFANLLFVLALAAWTLWYRYRRIPPRETNLLDDTRAALQRTGLYVALVIGFTFVYHSFIDPDLTERRIQQRLADQRADIDAYPTFEDFLAEHETLDADLTREELMAQQEEGIRSMLNPVINSAFSLIALIMWALVCSLGTAVLFRAVIFR